MGRDEIWDAICETWGMKPITKADCSRMGRLARDFRLKGATPAELRVRLDRYRLAWPQAADTPEALLKHWDRFSTAPATRPANNNPARIR